MNKITLWNINSKYNGWIIEYQPGKFISQNSNDIEMSLSYQDDLKSISVKVKRIIKVSTKNATIKILLCEKYSELKNLDERYFEVYNTLDDAIQSIVECWE